MVDALSGQHIDPKAARDAAAGRIWEVVYCLQTLQAT